MVADGDRGLAPVPFGAAAATAFDSVEACGSFLGGLPGAPSVFHAIGPERDFRIRFRTVVLPGMTLLAGTSTPKTVDHRSDRVAVVIPFGTCGSVIRSERREYRWASPYQGFFIPADLHVEAESTAGAFLRLDIPAESLMRTAAGMAGDDPHAQRDLFVRVARTVPLQAPGEDWLTVVRGLCGAVDAYACDPRSLAAAGVDDVFLRTVVMMLAPERFLVPPADASAGRSWDPEPLLERIEAALAGRVTLSDLEAWSGLSARTIQLSFQRRFGVTPMQWIRGRRLEHLRAKLLAAADGETVRALAASCGLARMATLIPEYERRFGELPSETLRRRGR
jgi:AraC-like DNA-binding protein